MQSPAPLLQHDNMQILTLSLALAFALVAGTPVQNRPVVTHEYTKLEPRFDATEYPAFCPPPMDCSSYVSGEPYPVECCAHLLSNVPGGIAGSYEHLPFER